MTRIPSRTDPGKGLKTGKLTPEQEQGAREWRLAFVMEVGRCEVCGDTRLEYLCGHETIRANLRRYVKCLRSIVLVVCNPVCHRRIEREAWPVERQLAYLYRSRPLDFRLSEVNRWSIRRIQRADVMHWAKQIEGGA